MQMVESVQAKHETRGKEKSREEKRMGGEVVRKRCMYSSTLQTIIIRIMDGR